MACMSWMPFMIVFNTMHLHFSQVPLQLIRLKFSCMWSVYQWTKLNNQLLASTFPGDLDGWLWMADKIEYFCLSVCFYLSKGHQNLAVDGPRALWCIVLLRFWLSIYTYTNIPVGWKRRLRARDLNPFLNLGLIYNFIVFGGYSFIQM